MIDSQPALSPEKLETAALILKTIAHPLRLSIVNILSKVDRLSVTDICKHLGDVDQSLVSHHLSTMKLKKILDSKREGRHIYYSLRLREVLQVLNCIEDCDIQL